jgi:predicted nucleic acid-binding protein
MRVVFDTNVLVAAARSGRGASHALLSRLPDEGFEPAISVPLFVEYRATLLRPENLLQRSTAAAEAFLDFLLSASHLQEVFFHWRLHYPIQMTTLFLSWQWPRAAAILSRTISGISGDRKSGELRR